MGLHAGPMEARRLAKAASGPRAYPIVEAVGSRVVEQNEGHNSARISGP